MRDYAGRSRGWLGKETTMIVFVSLLVALIGVLMYALAVNPKLQEIGRIAFAFGLLAFLLRLGPDVVSLFGGR